MTQAATRKSPSILQDVRDHCAWISGQAEHVKINADRLPEYTARILDSYPLVTSFDDRHLISPDEEEMAAYIIALNSLNFGSGYFGQAEDEGVHFDYALLSRGLRQAFTDRLLDTPEKWLGVTPENFHGIFSIPRGTNRHLDALFALFAKHLREDAREILKNYNGKAMNLVRKAAGSAERFVALIGAWPNFRDDATYKGASGPILKRAQITASYLDLCNLGGFTDMHRLTSFADNRIPHVLRRDGILSCTPGLAGRIDAGTPLAPGSEEETELRAAGVHVIELMHAAAAAQGRDVTPMNIDHILWNRGEEPGIHGRPHRTFCVWY